MGLVTHVIVKRMYDGDLHAVGIGNPLRDPHGWDWGFTEIKNNSIFLTAKVLMLKYLKAGDPS